MLGIVALAALLRLWHIGQGLPEFTDEAIPFRRALQMWGSGGTIDWNPHFFHYPSLTLYLQLLVQKLHYLIGTLTGAFSSPADYLASFQIDPTPMVISGRLVGVAADLVTVACAARIAGRLWPGAGPLAALLVACAPVLIGSSRAIFADSVMVAFATAALERVLAYRERGGVVLLATAAALIGLAAGAKYPGAVVLLPLAWVLWERDRHRAAGKWALATAGAFAVFLLTTPYAALDFATFRRDFEFVGRMGSEGTFGNIGRSAYGYHLFNLARELGWVGFALLPVSLAFIAWRAGTRGAGVAVWLALLGFALPVLFAHVLAERYVAPVTPLAAALVAAAALELAERLRLPRWRAIPATALAAVGLPALIVGTVAALRVADHTRIEARRWCESHLTGNELLVQEHYGAALLSRIDWYALQGNPIFAAAREDVRQRLSQRKWFSTVTLPLAVVGSPENVFKAADGSVARLPVFPHVADFNQIFYDPRLFAGVDYVLTSGGVRVRFEADPVRYALQNRFYALLDSTAQVAARFEPGPGRGGPVIVIYRLGERARRAIEAFGPLDPLWWAEYVPSEYRVRAQARLAPRAAAAVAIRDPDGEPAAWVASLDRIFATRFGTSVFALAVELMQHGHAAEARRLAEAVLAMEPGNPEACLIHSMASHALGRWGEARRMLERTLQWIAVNGGTSLPLRLEYADVLAHVGEIDSARAELELLMETRDPYIAAEAQRRLGDTGGAFAGSR